MGPQIQGSWPSLGVKGVGPEPWTQEVKLQSTRKQPVPPIPLRILTFFCDLMGRSELEARPALNCPSSVILILYICNGVANYPATKIEGFIVPELQDPSPESQERHVPYQRTLSERRRY